MDRAHAVRIKSELKAAGATHHGLAKPESRELPRILHKDEHIGGVVYGQVGGGNSAMLVATDQRVVFVDKRPLFMTADEITYDAVAGVKSNAAGPFMAVVLHTRIGDYPLRFVNANCAKKFVDFIDEKRVKRSFYNQPGNSSVTPNTAYNPPAHAVLDAKAAKYLGDHDEAVLSTLDRTGNIDAAVIHYTVDQDNIIYVLTKSGTRKGRNVYTHHQVALTIHDTGSLKTLQIQGVAEVETDQQTKENIFARIVRPRTYKGEKKMPPVTQIHDGAFMIIKILPTSSRFHDYSKS